MFIWVFGLYTFLHCEIVLFLFLLKVVPFDSSWLCFNLCDFRFLVADKTNCIYTITKCHTSISPSTASPFYQQMELNSAFVSRPGHVYNLLLHCIIVFKEQPVVEQRRQLALLCVLFFYSSVKCHRFIKWTAVNILVPFEFMVHWRAFAEWSLTCPWYTYVFRWSIKCYYLKQALYGLCTRHA